MFVVCFTVVIERKGFQRGWFDGFYKRQSCWCHPIFSLLRFIRFLKQALSLQVEVATAMWNKIAWELSFICGQIPSLLELCSLLKLLEAQRNSSCSLLHQ